MIDTGGRKEGKAGRRKIRTKNQLEFPKFINQLTKLILKREERRQNNRKNDKKQTNKRREEKNEQGQHSNSVIKIKNKFTT